MARSDKKLVIHINDPEQGQYYVHLDPYSSGRHVVMLVIGCSGDGLP